MNPAEIQAIVTLISLAGNWGTELYLKLKAIGELGPDEQTNIHNQIMAGINFDQSVKDRYAQWRVSVGLDPAPVAAPTVAAPPAPTAAPSTVHDSSHTIPPKEGSD